MASLNLSNKVLRAEGFEPSCLKATSCKPVVYSNSTVHRAREKIWWVGEDSDLHIVRIYSAVTYQLGVPARCDHAYLEPCVFRTKYIQD